MAGRLGFNKPETFQHRTNTGYGQLHGGLIYKPGRSQESLSEDTGINYIGPYDRQTWLPILHRERVQRTAICLN